ncbi:hypothetical protein TYRP_012511 [Tyrophagus putrescentiae]|nr:hypothetical protein TYRP_012511 [Tyrophagus putrescentiae]
MRLIPALSFAIEVVGGCDVGGGGDDVATGAADGDGDDAWPVSAAAMLKGTLVSRSSAEANSSTSTTCCQITIPPWHD